MSEETDSEATWLRKKPVSTRSRQPDPKAHAPQPRERPGPVRLAIHLLGDTKRGLLTAGALAGAIVALYSAAHILLPSGSGSGSAALEASIENLSVQPEVALEEYERRDQPPVASASYGAQGRLSVYGGMRALARTSGPVIEPVADVSTGAAAAAAQAPKVTTSPANVSVAGGESASFEAAAEGVPPPVVEWQVSDDGGVSWSAVAGAGSDTLLVSDTTMSESGREYRAVFTNGAGEAHTAAATLTVKHPPAVEAPKLTTSPANVSVAEGESASFEAAAESARPPVVEWQVSSDGGASWSALAGATNDRLLVSDATVSESGREYRAVFKNGTGEVQTAAATLTVKHAPAVEAPKVTKSPSSISVAEGANASFEVAAEAVPPAIVHWQVSTNRGASWSAVARASSDRLLVSDATVSESGQEYRAVLVNGAGALATAEATLTVKQARAPDGAAYTPFAKPPLPQVRFHRVGHALVLDGTGASVSEVDAVLREVNLLFDRQQTAFGQGGFLRQISAGESAGVLSGASPGASAATRIALPTHCGSSCALKQTVDGVIADSSSTVQAARKLLAIFTDSRSLVFDHEREPVGATVGYTIDLVGFAGSTAILEWSLWSRGGGRPLPRAWWRSVVAEQIQPTRYRETVSGTFWAPIPSNSGDYVFHLTVYDSSGHPHAEQETLPPFH